MAKAKLNGSEAMRARMRAIYAKSPDVFARAAYAEANVELREVKKRTPVDTSALRNSEYVDGPHRSGRSIQVAIVAGGPAAPYALQVHEDLDAHHRVGQAKYIESVLMESAPFILDRIAKRMDLE